MNLLHDWAYAWGIPQAALDDLAIRLTPTTAPTEAETPEAIVQQRVRLEAPRRGYQLFRNNSGAGKLENGSFVRWGLGNDSKKTNDVIKSADLIGMYSFVIGPEHMGQRIAQFASVECKRTDWRYGSGEEFEAQNNFRLLVLARGGRAMFATSPEDL